MYWQFRENLAGYRLRIFVNFYFANFSFKQQTINKRNGFHLIGHRTPNSCAIWHLQIDMTRTTIQNGCWVSKARIFCCHVKNMKKNWNEIKLTFLLIYPIPMNNKNNILCLFAVQLRIERSHKGSPSQCFWPLTFVYCTLVYFCKLEYQWNVLCWWRAPSAEFRRILTCKPKP